MSDNLHVYRNNIIEWMVAESPEDAAKVWGEFVGEEYDVEDSGPFEQEPDDKILFVDKGEGQEKAERKTCREWADQEGRTYLCSTEY